MRTSILFIVVVFLFVSGCSKDDAPITPPTPVAISGVYILNEGNFQRGNTTLSFYIPDSNKVYPNIFKSVNGNDLGDTGNSLTIHDGKAYIVVNGSNRIEVIDIKTNKYVKTITCPKGASPRYIVFGINNASYISNLYTNSVSIYDDVTNNITGSIQVGNNPEQMLLVNALLYVTNSGFGNGNTLSIINTNSNQPLKQLQVGDNPMAIEALTATTAVVLCSGAYNDFNDPNDDTPGKLYWLNTYTQTVTDSLVLGGHPQHIALDGNGNLYTVQTGGIQKIALANKTITNNFIPGYFYNIAFDSKRQVLYVTNPLDFVQPGQLEIYDLAGTKKKSFTVGIIPGAIAFTD